MHTWYLASYRLAPCQLQLISCIASPKPGHPSGLKPTDWLLLIGGKKKTTFFGGDKTFCFEGFRAKKISFTTCGCCVLLTTLKRLSTYIWLKAMQGIYFVSPAFQKKVRSGSSHFVGFTSWWRLSCLEHRDKLSWEDLTLWWCWIWLKLTWLEILRFAQTKTEMDGFSTGLWNSHLLTGLTFRA